MPKETAKNTKSVFDSFTGKYSLSKTLRFELVPVGKTADFLEKNKVFEKDMTIDESYRQAKFYFDEFHREFIRSAFALEKISDFPCKKFATAWEKYQKEMDSDKENAVGEWRKSEKEFRQRVLKYIEKEAKSRFGEKGIKFLLSKNVLDELKKSFPPEKNDEFVESGKPSLFVDEKENPGTKRYIFDSFDGFTGRLSKFQATRENLYKDDGTSTAIATRVASNFVVFLQNVFLFQKYRLLDNALDMAHEEKKEFEIENYKKLFLQEGIDEHNKIIGDLNKRVKELRDKHQKEPDFSKKNYPLLKTLEKQILGKVEKEKQIIVKDEDVFHALQDYIAINEERYGIAKTLVDDLLNRKYSDEDTGGIYLNSRAINTISRRWLADGFSFERALTPVKDRKKSDDAVKVSPFVSLADVSVALDGLEGEAIFKEAFRDAIDEKAPRIKQFLAIFHYEIMRCFEGDKSFVGYDSVLREARGMFEKTKQYDRSKEQIEIIKRYADAALPLFQLMRYFSLETKKQDEKPVSFCAEFYERYGKFRGDEVEKPFAARYYDAFRNYLTKKPGDEGKLKLNFESGQLLSGFDKNKEKEKLGIILRKDGKYYLGIINKNSNAIFDEKRHPEMYSIIGDAYEKMEYKLFPDPKRMIPHIAFPKKDTKNNKKLFGWTQEIQDIKDEYAQFQEEKSEDRNLWNSKFNQVKTRKLIEYYQNCLEMGGYKKTYDFKWKDAGEYSGIGEFNDDIARQNYRVRFVSVDSKYVSERVENGDLFLFKIHNRDFAPKAGGASNIHSLYFINLFSGANLVLKPPVLQLSGNAEIFYRESSELIQKEKRNFPREIIKYKRYTEPKIFLHLPVGINAGAEDARTTNQYNKKINTEILKPRGKEIAVIGIDRGERHLAYYSVVNQRGEILEQVSLNEVNGINYYELLRQREKERLENRRAWQSLRQIKDLKRGYVSHVIRKIVDLVVKYNAVVVLEDLNMRFKQIRGGIERSVYQQLEKALIDKFGYLVFKDRPVDAVGGALCGYQVAAPFESFEKMGKQTGIIFYTQAEYTSKTDPLTGFRKNIYISNSLPVGGTKDEKKRTLRTEFAKFKAIGWDDEQKSYFFEYDAKDFADANFNRGHKKDAEMPSRVWKVYANVPRIRREINPSTGYWEYEPVNPNSLLEKLFSVWNFENPRGDIWEQMWAMDVENLLRGKKQFLGRDKNFFESLIYIFNLILEIRNSFAEKLVYEKDAEGKPVENADGKLQVKTEGEYVDFIASPVSPFFRTKIKSSKFSSKPEFSEFLKPNFGGLEKRVIGENKINMLNDFNGDANGAYNIARKGIIILDRIVQNSEKPDLFISKSQWDKFVQKQWNNTSKSQK